MGIAVVVNTASTDRERAVNGVPLACGLRSKEGLCEAKVVEAAELCMRLDFLGISCVGKTSHLCKLRIDWRKGTVDSD
eukprot:6257820-Prymnesium_polylepis.1